MNMIDYCNALKDTARQKESDSAERLSKSQLINKIRKLEAELHLLRSKYESSNLHGKSQFSFVYSVVNCLFGVLLMPVHKVKGGYKWGKSGKVYKTKKEAEKQGRAIYASGYKKKKQRMP